MKRSGMSIHYSLLLLAAALSSANAQQPEDKSAPAKPVAQAKEVYPLTPPPPPVLDKEFLRSLKKDPNPEEKRDRAEAYQGQSEKAFPMTQEEIALTKKKIVEQERMLTYKGAPRKPRSRDVSWSVGGDSPTVHLAAGFTTTILFFDASGQPLVLAPQGSIVGDGEAIDNTTTGNAVVLYVKKPWVASNLTAFLNGVPVPVNLTLTSELDAQNAPAVDYQIRVRVQSSGGAQSMNRKDAHNMDALIRMINGVKPGGNFQDLVILGIEKGDPSRLSWAPVRFPVGSFHIGPEGHTYAVLRPGLRLVYPTGGSVIAEQTGADESKGYIVAGGTPRVFTAVDANGAVFRITVQR